MTDPRRSRQCHRDGCDSQATWQMFVRFVTRTPSGEIIPCTAETTIKVCDRHQKDAAEGFVGARSMDTFAAHLERENLAVPHPASIRIEFGRIAQEPCVLELRTAPPVKIIVCDRAGCIMPAKVQIALKLWNIGQSKRAKPLQVLTGLCVCGRHRNESTIRNVLTPAAKSKLLGDLTERGVPMPDFASAELAFVTLAEGRKADPARFAVTGAP
jgi:hypothetical protein